MICSFCYRFDNDDSSLFLYLIYTEDIIERYLIKSVNVSGRSASRTGRDVGWVGQMGRVGQVRLRGLWGERIGERRVNDIYFL